MIQAQDWSIERNMKHLGNHVSITPVWRIIVSRAFAALLLTIGCLFGRSSLSFTIPPTPFKAPIKAISFRVVFYFSGPYGPVWARPGILKSGRSSAKTFWFLSNTLLSKIVLFKGLCTSKCEFQTSSTVPCLYVFPWQNFSAIKHWGFKISIDTLFLSTSSPIRWDIGLYRFFQYYVHVVWV